MKVFDVPGVPRSPVSVVLALTTLTRYRGAILPVVDRELEALTRRATKIPDPALRGAALHALTEKRANVEATATLATLAPRRGRSAVVRAGTALQVVVDYLDTLGEQAGPDALADGLRLHRSLDVALTPGAAPLDWYEHHPRGEDGGYLDALVAICQRAVETLPGGAALPAARRAIARCGEGQSYTHADCGSELEAWAASLPPRPGLHWWEAAAGASSSVGAHALLALAGDPTTSTADAERVLAAYDPWIGALTVLLDDFVDRERDERSGDHNYANHWGEDAAERIDLLVAGARDALCGLSRRRVHESILSGILAYYLGGPTATGARRPTAADSAPVRTISAAIRLAA
jgi:tetraprenyl-beta-curcumene synthase